MVTCDVFLNQNTHAVFQYLRYFFTCFPYSGCLSYMVYDIENMSSGICTRVVSKCITSNNCFIGHLMTSYEQMIQEAYFVE